MLFAKNVRLLEITIVLSLNSCYAVTLGYKILGEDVKAATILAQIHPEW
jgi:hypothetical protein